MRFDTLAEWLQWQDTLHPRQVDLGLERCGLVAERMGLLAPGCPVITVAGTNGKGSCVAMLEGILRAAGYRTGAYTSPHLLRYNERVTVDGRAATDGALVEAFDRIDRARAQTSLTYYEFATLAALDIFAREKVQVMLLEVGLGGRLDAVNLVDADVAMVCTVDVDHVDWLGAEREVIAREKAGIFRTGRPAVCGEPEPPCTLEACAAERGAPLYRLAREYDFEEGALGWHWHHDDSTLRDLPRPGIPGVLQVQNAAAVLMVLQLLSEKMPVPDEAVRRGLETAHLPARFQVLEGPIERIVDVAHNVQAARTLARSLRARPCTGRTLAVFGMLADKDIAGVVAAMAEVVDDWYLGGLQVPRGASGEVLRARLAETSLAAPVSISAGITDAHAAALACARPEDRIVAFGSFHTAAEVLRLESCR